MGLLDFLFGKKEEFSKKASVENKEAGLAMAKESAPSPTIRTQEVTKTEMPYEIKPFTFTSNQHQRYENGSPVMGEQNCMRSISVEKNVLGCNGYQLRNGDGYIVRAMNLDANKPQFAPKPMRLDSHSPEKDELRGYVVSTRTPLGYQDIDLSDYGLTIYYKNESVSKVVLHMFDRNTDLEYRNISKAATSTSLPQNIQDIIDAASTGLAAVQKGNRRLEQENLFSLFNLTQEKSSQLLHIPAEKYNLVGSGFCLLLEYPQVRANEEVSRAIADYAFYCISKAIEQNPSNKTLYLKRMSIVAQTREFFFYTVANALEIPDSDPFDIMLRAPLIVRTNDYIFAMGKYDFENGDKIAFEGVLKDFHELCYGQHIIKTASDGKTYIDKVNEYIANSIKQY